MSARDNCRDNFEPAQFSAGAEYSQPAPGIAIALPAAPVELSGNEKPTVYELGNIRGGNERILEG